jgi:hypothetical protein
VGDSDTSSELEAGIAVAAAVADVGLAVAADVVLAAEPMAAVAGIPDGKGLADPSKPF